MKYHLVYFLACTLILSGCLQSFTTITVHRDGSAHVVDTILVGSFLSDMLQNLQTIDDSTDDLPPISIPWSDSTVRAHGSLLGEGVILEGWMLVEKDGMKGYSATYRVQNINSISLARERSWDGMGVPSGEQQATTSPDPVTFDYNDGLLTINNPPPTPKTESRDDKKDNKDLASSLPMISQFLRGMKMNLNVSVDTPILSTNAQHVHDNTITLMSVDFDKLVDAWQHDAGLLTSFGEAKNGDPKALEKTLGKYPPGAIVIDFNKKIKVKF